jgi:outer membrane protein TolC
VRRQEYDLAVALLESARRRVRAQDAAEIEVVRAEAGVAQRVSEIIVAENAVRDAERSLKRAINADGLGMETPTKILLGTPPSAIYFQLDAVELVAEALAQRMEMLELELQVAQDASSIDFARNQKLPLVSLDYRYNVNGLGGTWNDSLDLLSDRSFEDHIIGLNVEIPLGNAAATSRLNQAILTRLQRLATVEQRRQQIENEIYNSVDQIEADWQRVLASGQSTLLEKRVLDAELRQFELGLRTSTDVRDAQTRYANAQLNEILALTDYQISQVDIAFATGTLLGSDKVRWEASTPDLED